MCLLFFYLFTPSSSPPGSNYQDTQKDVTDDEPSQRDWGGDVHWGGAFVNGMDQTWQAADPGSKLWTERDGRTNLWAPLTLNQTNLEQQQRPRL